MSEYYKQQEEFYRKLKMTRKIRHFDLGFIWVWHNEPGQIREWKPRVVLQKEKTSPTTFISCAELIYHKAFDIDGYLECSHCNRFNFYKGPEPDYCPPFHYEHTLISKKRNFLELVDDKIEASSVSPSFDKIELTERGNENDAIQIEIDPFDMAVFHMLTIEGRSLPEEPVRRYAIYRTVQRFYPTLRGWDGSHA